MISARYGWMPAACLLLLCLPVGAQNLIVNPGFETANRGEWGAQGAGLEITNRQAHSGRSSVYCFNRTQEWQGPQQGLRGRLEHGQRYHFSAWARLEKGSGLTLEMMIAQWDAGGENYPVLDARPISDDGWTHLTGAFDYRPQGEVRRLDLYFQLRPASASFYVDDVSLVPDTVLALSPAGDGRTRIALQPGAGKPSAVTPCRLRIESAEGSAVAEQDVAMGGAAVLYLPDGFYQATVTVPQAAGGEVAIGKAFVVGDPREVLGPLLQRARSMQADPAFASAAGWLDYLAGRVEGELTDAEGMELSPVLLELLPRLAKWLARIQVNPDVVAELRGTVEWAYLSRVDGTGQPFEIVIPEDYNFDQAYPLWLQLHGRTGTHHSGAAPRSDRIHLSVLGRSRAGGYHGLSEVDVLEALDYVRAHWNIDADRIHVYGTSMGGGGTFQMVTRHPDLFASARPQCGFGLHTPLGNAVHVPLRSLHSIDDGVVPVSNSRLAVRRLNELGGSALQDETDGLGHAVWEWTEGIERAEAWEEPLARATEVRHVRYQATDELARGAYWLEVMEWGAQGRPATIDARLQADNTLRVVLDNVAVAKIDLASSPADSGAALNVVVNDTAEETVDPPLPEALYLAAAEDGWQISGQAPLLPRQRLHFPGGAMALYHGEPLMIVWGTQADEETNRRMEQVAQAARRSCNPTWPGESEVVNGIPMVWTLYGKLPGKTDVEVTPEDLQHYNLMLIGTPDQNALAARIADRLPVRIEGERVVTGDGVHAGFRGRALGLLYYNPLAPHRLIYWAASETAAFYRPGTSLMELQGDFNAAPPDFVVMDAETRQIALARRFDSRWRWEAGYTDSPRLAESQSSAMGASLLAAQRLRRAAGAEIALLLSDWARDPAAFVHGETRTADLAALAYDQPLVVMEMTGAELSHLHRQLTDAYVRGGPPCRMAPSPAQFQTEPERRYRVVAEHFILWPLIGVTHSNPEDARLMGVTLRDAMLLRDRTAP